MTAPATNLELRRASVADVEVITRIWHQGWRDGHLGHVPRAILPHRSRAAFRRRVPDQVPDTVVAVLGGQVVGFITVRDDEIEQLYVAEAARGTGTAAERSSVTANRSFAAAATPVRGWQWPPATPALGASTNAKPGTTPAGSSTEPPPLTGSGSSCRVGGTRRH